MPTRLQDLCRPATRDELSHPAIREWPAVLSDTHEPGTFKIRYRGLHRFCSRLVDEAFFLTQRGALSPDGARERLKVRGAMAAIGGSCGAIDYELARSVVGQVAAGIGQNCGESTAH